MNIQEQVQNSLNDIVLSGKIEELISSKIEKTIDDILSSSLREYSDFGKKLKEVVDSSLQINLDKVSALGYQKIVMDIVNEKLKQAVMDNISAPLEKVLSEIIAPFERRTYKISEIIEKYKEHEWDSSDDDDIEISFHIETSDWGNTSVSFDKNPDKERYNCKYQLNLNKGDNHIWMFNIKGYRPQTGDLRSASIHGAFDHFIFNLYASQCPIELDENSVETYWSREDY